MWMALPNYRVRMGRLPRALTRTTSRKCSRTLNSLLRSRGVHVKPQAHKHDILNMYGSTSSETEGRLRQRVKVSAVCTPTLAAPPPVELDVPRGQTAGALMVLDEVSVQAGDVDLLSEVSWTLMPGQHVGLVGANGCGKSTLVRCLTGLRGIDAGRIAIGHKVEVGYLEQTAVSGSTRTVWQEARSRMTRLIAAEAALEAAAAAMAAGDVSAGDALEKAQDQFEAAGGLDADRRIANVLTGLGFQPEQWEKRCDEFSGGWQMRIALARLLLGPAAQAASGDGMYGAGLLLLDEPTNHLDRAACKWLAQYLKNCEGGMIIVSHDEALLEAACTHVVEVRGRQLHHYVGRYSEFLEQRTMREQQAQAQAATQQIEMDKLENFITKFGAKATKATQAQSKAKALEKLKARAVVLPTAASSVGGGDFRKMTLQLAKAPPCHQEIMVLEGAEVGWGQKSPEAQPLLQNVNLVVKRGQRILVLGPNGAGKSTLIKAISGKLPLWSGKRKLGEGAKVAIFSQDLAQDLPLDKCGLDYVLDRAREEGDTLITNERGRQVLGALGLHGSAPLRRIRELSGGEKARVALAAFALVPCNLLLLDEASNHLDAATIDILTGALQKFEGAIVAITHNAMFGRNLGATHVLRVANGGATLANNLGLRDADFDHAVAATAAPPPAKPAPVAVAPKKAAAAAVATAAAAPARGKAAQQQNGKSAAAAPPAKGLSYFQKQEMQKLEKEIESLGKKKGTAEAHINKLNLAGDTAGVVAASKELQKVLEEQEAKEMRWLELAELASS